MNKNLPPPFSERHIQYKAVDSLKFDPQNPRLPSNVSQGGEEAIIKWMLEDAGIIELMASIGEQGYFPGEPLLVVAAEPDLQEFLVVEGNRRLTAVKLLLQPELASIRKIAVQQVVDEAVKAPDTLPVVVFPKREAILDYLGYRHITGIKAWGALAKARYLNQLLNRLAIDEQSSEQQNRKLAKTIGSRADAVARRLAGYAVYKVIEENDFFDIPSVDEQSISFSVLTAALNWSNIHQFVGLQNGKDRALKTVHLPHLKELTAWIFEKNSENKTRLGESRNLGDLNSVIGEKRALAAFRAGMPLKQAVILTEKPAEIFRSALIESQSRLETARDYIHNVDGLSQSDSERLLEIQKLARSLRSIVDTVLIETEEL